MCINNIFKLEKKTVREHRLIEKGPGQRPNNSHSVPAPAGGTLLPDSQGLGDGAANRAEVGGTGVGVTSREVEK